MIESDSFTDEKISQSEEQVLNEPNEMPISWRAGNWFIPVTSVPVSGWEKTLENAPGIAKIIKVEQTRQPVGQNYEDDQITYKSYNHEPWTPYRGYSKVTKGIAFNKIYFNNTSAFNNTSTYEQESQVYNKNFANYNGYWQSNLPCAYKDTQVFDTLDNFTVGSACASSIRAYTYYYTSMSLYGQSAQTATVRIKGQLGYRWPNWCYSTWCVFPSATSSTIVTFTAPNSGVWWTY